LARPRSILAAALMAALILAGALIWYRPYLTARSNAISEVPAPSALFAVSEFSVPAGGRACMDSVTVNPNSRVAAFMLRPARPTPAGGPPVDLVLSAPGYRATLHVPGGYPGGSVALSIASPPRAEIGTACFVNRGRSTVLLDGTTEARTVSRSRVLVDGYTAVGDIALTFYDSRSRSLLDGLGEVFGHASNLTDRLVPVWLIWLLSALVALGVPCGMTVALYHALRTDERSGRI
jgi:hypothetical protein